MKKLITMFLLGVLVFSMAPTSFADENSTATPGEVEAFKAAIQEKKAIVQAAADENKLIRQATAETRAQIKLILSEIKASGTPLDETTKESLNALRLQVSEKVEALTATKGAIKAYMDENRVLLKSLDYTVLDTIFADVAAIQSTRNALLTEINALVNQMLTLLSI